MKTAIGYLEFDNESSNPTDLRSDRYGLAFISGTLSYWNGTTWASVASGTGSNPSFDDVYDDDRVLLIDAGVLEFRVTTENNGLYLNKSNVASGDVLVIANSGTGKDITGPAWSFISTGSVGILELASGGTINATDGALTIGKTGTATSFAGTATVAEGMTLTAGTFTHSDGLNTLIDNANDAQTLLITNNTISTYGAGPVASAGMVVLRSTSLTTGSLLKLQLTEGTLNGGNYLDCYDVTGSAIVFKVAEDGATTITGAGATNVLTLTAGDVLMSDGSLTMTDADNAASLSITNNTATTASVFVFAGSGVFTGSTTSSFMTITPSGLTTGTAVYLPVAGLTTGKALDVVANALTTGQVVSIASSATAITGNGRLFLSTHSGATGTSAVLNEFISAANDETVVLQVKVSDVLAAGKIVNVSGASMTTGTAIAASDLNALTTGIGLHVASSATAITGAGRLVYVNHTGTTSTSGILAEFLSAATDETVIAQFKASAALALGKIINVSGASLTTGTAVSIADLNALTTGIGVHIASSATAITGAGRMFYSNHTGATGTSATLNEFASAATDETIIAQITASGALALGTALGITADACTTGFGINMSMDALTSGVAINIHSDSADVSARDLVHIHNDNVAAVGTVPIQIVQDAVTSTHFKKIATLGGVTLWVSDATTANGALTGTAGDICFNGGTNKPEYCTGTTNWTALV